MNQKILCHFEMLVNEKYFEFNFQPGITNFEDIYAALNEFKKEIDVLQERALEADLKAKEEAAAKESPEVDAEVMA
jgi:hypothetical protein